ncbi:MAG TPA: histidine kinase dimerization/phospho-acceptor domain-containing protein [Caldimonas sp.]|nr:histidine kinase dimerization/phospho-acceptor domain-containing protein [Caldimonas sp.]
MKSTTTGGGLFRKYAAVLILLVGGMLLLSSLVSIYFAYQETKATLVGLERQQTLAAASRIAQMVTRIEWQLRAVMQVPFDDPRMARAQREIDFLRLLRDVPAIAEIVQLDASGKVQLLVSRFAPNEIGSQRELAKDPRYVGTRIGRTYFGPVYFRNDSEPHLTIAVPWGDGAPEVAAAEVNLNALREVVSQARVGTAGYVYVVDGQGFLIAHPDMSAVYQKRNLSGLPQIRAANAASAAHDGLTGTTGLRGGQVLTGQARIESLGWLVVAEQPLDEAFVPLKGTIGLSAIFFFIGLALAMIASVLLARRMVAPIRVLQQGATRIGAGDLGHRIAVRTGDELEALGQEFNRTARQLEESYATLEQKVEARTRELATANEELKALGEVGRAVSSTLDLETVLNTIVARAVQLSAANGGIIYEYNETSERFDRIRGSHQLDEDVGEVLRSAPLGLGEGVTGKAAATRAPVQVADVLDGRTYDVARIRVVFERHGLRAVLAVPLLFEQRIIGALVVWRQEPGQFAAGVVNLLQTFASQSVLAILNARLFHEVKAKSREVEAASLHKSEFLANMSHELRTPLNAIIGFSEVLSERMFGEINDKQAEYLSDILESGRHLLSLINDILDLSKIEAGRMELEPTQFDMRGAVENALALVRERAQRRGIRLERAIDERIGSICADERKVKQGPAEPAVQRAEVHSGGRNGLRSGRIARWCGGSLGHRHRRGHRPRGSGGRVRRVSAGRRRGEEGGRHRARTRHLAQVHRAPRRKDLGRKPSWGRVDLHLHAPVGAVMPIRTSTASCCRSLRQLPRKAMTSARTCALSRDPVRSLASLRNGRLRRRPPATVADRWLRLSLGGMRRLALSVRPRQVDAGLRHRR